MKIFNFHQKTASLSGRGKKNSKIEEEVSISVIPNPFSETVHIKYELENTANITLSIYDLNGRLFFLPISNQIFNRGIHTQELNVETLPQGLYIAILSINGKRRTVKLVKESFK